jgi:hypothetical protein
MADPRPGTQDRDTQALTLAAEAIGRDFGNLDDFPVEFADTIANIYFKFFMLALGELFTTRREKLSTDPVLNFMDVSSDLTASVNHVPGMVKELREMRQAGRKDLFDYWVTFTLDDLKYKIQNAGEKSAIRRSLERRFKKSDEIGGLYLIMRGNIPPQ